MKIYKCFLLLFLIAINFGCKEEVVIKDEPKDDTTPIHYSNGIKGNIQKGPFISGSNVTVQLLDEKFVPTGVTFSINTNNDFGGFELERKLEASYVEIITSGFYYNEVIGKISEASLTLRSLAENNDSAATNVNILTTLARDRIIHLMKTDSLEYTPAKKQAQHEILSIFNIVENEDIDFNSLDISKDGDENAILLAISVVLQAENSVGELSELISKIIQDIKEDGILDNETIKKSLKENAKKLNFTSISNNLKNRYAAINQLVDIPNFEKYAKRLTSLEVTKTYPENDAEVKFDLDSVLIWFNKPLDVTTINENNIVILDNSIEKLTGSFLYDKDEYKVIFLPDAELKPYQFYRIKITSNLKGIDNTNLDKEFKFQFKPLEVDIEKGLKQYFSFSNSADDDIPGGLAASLVNTTFVEDMNGNANGACKVNGIGSYVEFPNVVNITNPNWTYSVWVNFKSLKSGVGAMLLGTKESGLDWRDNPLYARADFKIGSYNGTSFSTPACLEINKWYHITAVIENSIMSVYVNGNQISVFDTYKPLHNPKDPSDPDLNGESIGLFNFYAGKYLVSQKKQLTGALPTYVDGIVDNIRFYDRALNKYEVYELYTNKQ